MVDVFNRTITRREFAEGEVEMMRDAYVRALAALNLVEVDDRRHLARIVQKLGRVERFPGAEHLASLAIEWYLAGRE